MRVDPISVRGSWWRQIPVGGDVHYQPDEPDDGRWQRGDIVAGLYFADSPETAWAEWYRYLAEALIPPIQALPRDLWEWRIDLDEVGDLSDVDKLTGVDLPPPRPGRAQWPAYQVLGARLWQEGFRAVVAPSAARAEGSILCAFRTTRIVEGTAPVPPPRTYAAPPLVPRGMST